MKYVYLSLVTVLATNICVDSPKAAQAAGTPTAADDIFLGFTMPGAAAAPQETPQGAGTKRDRGVYKTSLKDPAVAASLEEDAVLAEPAEALRSACLIFGMEELRSSLSRIASRDLPHGDMHSCDSDASEDDDMHPLSTAPGSCPGSVASFRSLSAGGHVASAAEAVSPCARYVFGPSLFEPSFVEPLAHIALAGSAPLGDLRTSVLPASGDIIFV
jgi:hypothetical protein